MTSYNDIDNNADILDSRDVIAAYEDLQSELETRRDSIEDYRAMIADLDGDDDETADDYETEIDILESEIFDIESEAADLIAFVDECENSVPDWNYGEALIRETYFTEYAQQLAEDIGAVDPNADWPASYIDWEAAADALLIDYTAYDFGGVTYYAR